MRFQFAFALSHNARLFLMDEPASSVRTLDVADTAGCRAENRLRVGEERQFFWEMDALGIGAGARNRSPAHREIPHPRSVGEIWRNGLKAAFQFSGSAP